MNIHIKNARLGSSPTRKTKPLEKTKAPYSKKEIRDMYDAKRRKSGAVQQVQPASRSPKKDLSEVYEGKARRMHARLKEQVAKHALVPGGVKLKPTTLPKDIHSYADDKEELSFVESSEPLDLDLIPDREDRGLKKGKPKRNYDQIETTVTLDVSLSQYEREGGDAKFIRDITKSIGVEPSQMKITKKRSGSVILTFTVNL